MTREPAPNRLSLSGIRAVVFDLDDTLYPESSYVMSGFTAVCSWLRGRVAVPFDPLARMKELFESGDRRHVFDALLRQIGGSHSPGLLEAMIQCYRDHFPDIELHPDARRALDAWHGRVHLGLITDGPRLMQQRKVRALELERWLCPIVFTDEWGPAAWKPHPRGFQHLEAHLGLCGSELVYIADNCGKDFIAPRRLGWQTVQVRRPGGLYCDVPSPADGVPEHQVQSLSELDLSLGVP